MVLWLLALEVFIVRSARCRSYCSCLTTPTPATTATTADRCSQIKNAQVLAQPNIPFNPLSAFFATCQNFKRHFRLELDKQLPQFSKLILFA